MRSLSVILFTLVLLSSCDLFKTRTPDEPDSGRVDIKPATSPENVIDNFQYSVNNKNIDYFMLCLSDSSLDGSPSASYVFYPSADVGSQFGDLFKGWNRNKEYLNFQSMINNMSDSSKPELKLSAQQLPKFNDSALFTANYIFKVPHNIKQAPTLASGTIQLVLISKNGKWSIQKWYDIKLKNDSIDATWSRIKTLFAN